MNTNEVTFTVSRTGQADFTSIQAAIDALPETGGTVRIAPGIYQERVEIRKPHVTLLGEDARTTRITAKYYARMKMDDGTKRGTFRSYTVLVFTHDLHAENITFENAAGLGADVGQAIALYAEGDKLSFKNCQILGAQDTLFTGPLPPKEIEKGGFTGPTEDAPRTLSRQLYENCFIAGEIDFIFGSARAYFKDCTLFAINAHKDPDAYYSAPSTYENDPYGYVFDHCTFTGDCAPGTAYLARPWRDYAKCAYLHCTMDAAVNTFGFNDWNKPQTHETAHFVQYDCTGAGAGSPKTRPEYVHFIDEKEASKYAMANVLGNDFNQE